MNDFEESPRIMQGFCEVCKDKDCPILTIGNTAYDDGEEIGICYECSHELWIQYTVEKMNRYKMR